MDSPTQYTYEEAEYDFTAPVYNDVKIITVMEPNNYIIHFDLNGGSGSMVDKVANSMQHHIPIDSSQVHKDGYNLDGWTLNQRSNPQVFTDEIVDPLSNTEGDIVTLYAKWSKIHTVTFDSMGGTAVPSQNVVNGGKATQPAAPQRTDYTFMYWYQIGSPDVSYDFNSVVANDIQLAAMWDATGTHTVRFMSGLGQTMATQVVIVGQCAHAPVEKPYRPGYTATGWCLNTSPTQPFDFNTPVETDLILLVMWEENNYTVHFDTNGGKESAPADIHVMATGSCDLPSSGLTREGYKFVGWTKVRDGSNPMTGTVTASVFYDCPVETTLYASWDRLNVVNFDPMDGINPITVKYVDDGEKVDATGVAIADSREHYTFKYWHLVSEEDEFNFDTPITGDINLYASWDVDSAHKVEFYKKLQDGTEVLAGIQNVYHGDKAVEPIKPAVEGMVFLGWYDTNDRLFDFKTPITADVKLVTKWRPATYTIHFDYNGGSGSIGDKTVPVFLRGIELDNSSVSWGVSVFDGWNTQKDGSGDRYEDVITNPLSDQDGSTVTLYAQWILKHEVKFDTSGGSAIPSQIVDDGDKATRPSNPTKTSFSFDGWYSDSGLTVPYDFSSAVHSDLTIYAKWNKVVIRHTVTFETNGGTPVTPKTVRDGGTVKEPFSTKEGYDLEGWYSDSGLTKRFDFSKRIFQDMTLYAKWVEETVYYTVTFETNGGTAVSDQKVEDGGLAVKPMDPSRSGYTFDGWFADSGLTKAFDFEQPIHSDVKVYAGWTEHVDPPVPEDNKLILFAAIALLVLILILLCYVVYKRRSARAM